MTTEFIHNDRTQAIDIVLEEFWSESGENGPHEASGRLLLDTTDQAPGSTAVIDHPLLAVVQIPLSEIPHRRFELPSRSQSFGILIASDGKEAADTLNLLAESLLVCSTPWRSQLWIILDSDQQWKKFSQQYLSPSSKPSSPPRLWSPDPLVEKVLLPSLRQYVASNATKNLKIWDMGAGIGRDACFLAEALSRTEASVQVTAVDQRYRAPDSNETTAFWQRRQSAASSSCRCLCIDLQNAVDATVEEIEREKVDCVFAVRYWNRKLFTALVERGTVPILAVSQFGKERKGADWRFTTPKERSVLERDELKILFISSGTEWEILHDKVEYERDKGRSLIQFLARRAGQK